MKTLSRDREPRDDPSSLVLFEVEAEDRGRRSRAQGRASIESEID